MPASRPRVFIGSSTEGLNIAKAIQINLDYGCEVVLWSQGVFGLSSGTLESLVEVLETFDFAVLVVTPDDMVTSRGETTNAPRDNVLLELGMCIGGIGHRRTFFVYDRTSGVKLPSDLAGITPATFHCHGDGNLQAALGAATSQIQDVIDDLKCRSREADTEAARRHREFLVIHSLLDPAHEQYIILMHEKKIKLPRRRSLFDESAGYEYWCKDQTAGKGIYPVDDMCRKLADADILEADLHEQISLTPRGNDFAAWLCEHGHRATFFSCDAGTWGEIPEDVAKFLWPPAPQMEGVQEIATRYGK